MALKALLKFVSSGSFVPTNIRQNQCQIFIMGY